MYKQFIPVLFMLLTACANNSEQKAPAASSAPAGIAATPAPPAAESTAEQRTTAPKAPKTLAPKPKIPAAPRTAQPPGAPQPPVEKVPPPPDQPVRTFSHSLFDSILQKYVSNDGRVDYKSLKNNKLALENYCQMLSDNPPQNDWSRASKMAFWINAYNAFTLKLIVDNFPTSSIMNLDGGKPWDVRRIQIGDKKYSLNNIENEILRPQFKDPRIHFAVNCAAKSCPPLWNHAYTADNLDAALDQRARAFINNTQFNAINTSKIRISKIFEWYAVDFGNIRQFLNKYADAPIESNGAVEYVAYDWGLNGGK